MMQFRKITLDVVGGVTQRARVEPAQGHTTMKCTEKAAVSGFIVSVFIIWFPEQAS